MNKREYILFIILLGLLGCVFIGLAGQIRVDLYDIRVQLELLNINIMQINSQPEPGWLRPRPRLTGEEI